MDDLVDGIAGPGIKRERVDVCCDFAKVRVAGSNPVVRSIKLQVRGPLRRVSCCLETPC